MGEILDKIAAIIFVCLVVPKTVIISKLYSINISRRVLWKASVGSFLISLASLTIAAVASLPLIVGIAYDLSGSAWLRAGPFLIGYVVVTIFPGAFYEQYILSKGGMEKSAAFKMCVNTSVYMLLASLALALFLYIVAMNYF